MAAGHIENQVDSSTWKKKSWGSSVSIESDYRLEDRTAGAGSPAEAKDFSSSLSVRTHPASYPMGTRGPFPGIKARPGRDADLSHPSSAEVKNEQRSITLSLLSPALR
jgi:hypothetical protein